MADTYTINPTTGRAVIRKDPAALLDYTFDWTLWVDGVTVTIASQTTTTPAVTGGPTVVSSAIVGKTVVAWISGGTAGITYLITNQITCSGTPARVDERTISLQVEDR